MTILGPQNAEEAHVSTCRDLVLVEEVLPQADNGWFGFKIVRDNIVHPGHQSVDTRTQSLHYFHAFAALNSSETRLDVNLTEFDLQLLLPSPEDLNNLKSNFQFILQESLPSIYDV